MIDADLRAIAEQAKASKPENDDVPWPWQTSDPVIGLDIALIDERSAGGGTDDNPWLVPMTDTQLVQVEAWHPARALAALDVIEAARAVIKEGQTGIHYYDGQYANALEAALARWDK